MATFQNIQCNIIVKYDRVYIYIWQAGFPKVLFVKKKGLSLFFLGSDPWPRFRYLARVCAGGGAERWCGQIHAVPGYMVVLKN